MKYSEIAKLMNGNLIGEDGEFQQLSSDTRTMKPGDTYIALKGEKFDGHQFLGKAIQNGAACLVVQDDSAIHDFSGAVIQVSDTTLALGLFASGWRQQFNIPVIGITGSCGKTTVKTIIGGILSLVGETLVTEGTFNNQFGLPYTLLRLNRKHQFAVVEIGTNHFGEIAYLTKLLKPTVSLITNIRAAHLAGLNSLADVAKEKGDIYRYLSKQGTAVFNIDERYVSDWQSHLSPSQKTIRFGFENGDVTATDIDSTFTGVKFNLCYQKRSFPVQLKVAGRHSVYNALAAAAVCLSLDIPMQTIIQGLELFEGVKGRLKKHHLASEVVLIDDSYNANPDSFKAAIEVLAKAPGPKILVMGDMKELGQDEIKFHHELGEYAKANGVDHLFAVGALSQHAVQAFGEGAKTYEEKQQLAEDLSHHLKRGTTVLVKGSRSTQMEDVINQLIK